MSGWTADSIQQIRQIVVDELRRNARLAASDALTLHIKVEDETGVVGYYDEVVGSGDQTLQFDIVMKTSLHKEGVIKKNDHTLVEVIRQKQHRERVAH